MTDPRELSRRELLGAAARGAALLPVAGAVGAALQGCGGSDSPDAEATPPAPRPAPPQAKAPASPPKPAAAPAAPATGGTETRLVTEIPSVAPQVQALQYVAESAKPDQSCANCLFFTAGENQRGKCQLFPQGLVAAGGWCVSWAAKV